MLLVPVTAGYSISSDQARYLPMTTLTIQPEMTCLEIAQDLLAAHKVHGFDLEFHYAGLGIGLPDDDNGFSVAERALRAVVLHGGALDWDTYKPTVTFGDLQRTADAGLAQRPEDGLTFILTGGYGGLGAADWAVILELLDEAYKRLVELGAVYAGYMALKDLLGGAAAAIRRGISAAQGLVMREDYPGADRIDQLLERSVELRPDVLSHGLGLSTDEVRDLLRLLGYVQSNDAGPFLSSDDDVVRFARLIYRHAKWTDDIEAEDLPATKQELIEAIDYLTRRIANGEAIPDNPSDPWIPPQ